MRKDLKTKIGDVLRAKREKLGVLFAPVAHRLLHKFHLQFVEEDEARRKPGDSAGHKPNPS